MTQLTRVIDARVPGLGGLELDVASTLDVRARAAGAGGA